MECGIHKGRPILRVQSLKDNEIVGAFTVVINLPELVSLNEKCKEVEALLARVEMANGLRSQGSLGVAAPIDTLRVYKWVVRKADGSLCSQGSDWQFCRVLAQRLADQQLSIEHAAGKLNCYSEMWENFSPAPTISQLREHAAVFLLRLGCGQSLRDNCLACREDVSTVEEAPHTCCSWPTDKKVLLELAHDVTVTQEAFEGFLEKLFAILGRPEKMPQGPPMPFIEAMRLGCGAIAHSFQIPAPIHALYEYVGLEGGAEEEEDLFDIV